MTERVWTSEPFAAPFLLLPMGIGLLTLIASPAPEKAIVFVLEMVVPFVAGSFWVRGARTPTGALARGAVVGLAAGIAIIIGASLAIRSVRHDDVAPLAVYALVPVLTVVAPGFGVLCTSLALAVRWSIRRGRSTPF